MGFLDRIASLAGGAIGGAVTIESAILPPIRIPVGDSAAGPPSLLLSLVRPRVTVQLPTGPYSIAPAGDPPALPWLGLAVAAGGAGVLALAVYGAVRLVRG